MKKLHSLLLSILVAPSLLFAVAQDAAIDKDKDRNDTRGPVNWKTTRTGEYDVPHVIATNSDGTAIGAGGGGGGAATIADGADVTQGSKADAKSTATDTTAITQMSVLKQISASVQAPPSQAVTNAGTFAVQSASTIADGASATLGAKADNKSTATDTTAISAISILKEISAMVQAPPSQAVTNTGTFATQSAATIADGSNVTLGAKADAKSTATDTTSVSAMQVLKEISAMEQAPASRAVTNAGTFATQSILTTGSAQIGHLEANQSSNVAQINGVTPLMGAGATGTGSSRNTPVTPATIATGQVTASGSPATLVAANSTRALLTVRNQDTSLSVYVGPATVSSSNGALLKAGESRSFRGATLLQVIAPSGSPVVDYVDESY